MTNDIHSDVCKICFRPASAPYRRVVDGKIVEGCISAFHTGRLVEISDSNRWHNRPEAKAFRRNSKFDFNPNTGYWVKE